jgi:uncharacterized protein (DUF1919 family)
MDFDDDAVEDETKNTWKRRKLEMNLSQGFFNL